MRVQYLTVKRTVENEQILKLSLFPWKYQWFSNEHDQRKFCSVLGDVQKALYFSMKYTDFVSADSTQRDTRNSNSLYFPMKFNDFEDSTLSH